MDGQKLFSKNDEVLGRLLTTVKEFRNDIGVDLGIDKCVKGHFVRYKKK